MKVEEGVLVSSEVVRDSYSGVLPDCDQVHGSGERGLPSPQLMVIWVRCHSSSASRKGSGCKGGPKPLSKGSMACGTRRVVGSCSLAVVCQRCVFDISFEYFYSQNLPNQPTSEVNMKVKEKVQWAGLFLRACDESR